MAKYIRCRCCGKRVNFDELIYRLPGRCGIYCSPDCFVDGFGQCCELNEDVAGTGFATIYDDKEDKRKLEEDIAKAEAEIAELTKKVKANKVLLTQYE